MTVGRGGREHGRPEVDTVELTKQERVWCVSWLARGGIATASRTYERLAEKLERYMLRRREFGYRRTNSGKVSR